MSNLKFVMFMLVFVSHSVFVVPVKEDRNVQMLLGVMLCLRHAIPHLASQEVKDHSMKGSFGVTKKEAITGVTSEQLLQVRCQIRSQCPDVTWCYALPQACHTTSCITRGQRSQYERKFWGHQERSNNRRHI